MRQIRRIIADGPYDLREYEGTGGTGGAGRLVENLLGISANNIPSPDSVEYEIKTGMDATSLVTLFHKEPGGRSPGAMSALIKGFGWLPIRGDYEAGTLSFRHTVGSEPSERGFCVTVDDEAVRVNFDSRNVAPEHSGWLAEVKNRCGGNLTHPPIWTTDELSRTGSRKLPNCVYVRGEKRRSIVDFKEAKILRRFLPSAFFRGLRRGAVLVDFDARMSPNGSIRNHGTKFRVRQRDFGSLYEEIIE